MTVITEHRLKCDYELCGVKSPVVDVKSSHLGHKVPVVMPPGWCDIKEHYIENDPLGKAEPPKFFCTLAHKEAWEKQQAERTV